MSLSRLSAVTALRPRLAVAAAFSSPAEDAAKKMTFGVKSAKAPGAAKENNVKHFKIYRWNPDTKGQTTSAVDKRTAVRRGGRRIGADPIGSGNGSTRRSRCVWLCGVDVFVCVQVSPGCRPTPLI